MGIIGFGTMMPIRYYLQEQERKEREQMMYELSRASSKWMQATGDSMMQDINRQQMESLTASMKSLDEIGRSLDSLGSSIALLDTTSLLAERSETTQVKRPSSDLDDFLGIKKVRARIAEHPTPSLYLDAGIK
jgi:hypothetical protein